MNIQIQFDAKSYQRDADVTANDHYLGNGEDARDLIHNESVNVTSHQDTTLSMIEKHGIAINISPEGEITACPTIKPVSHCDKGHSTTAETRRVPTGGGGAVILCRACHNEEMSYRRDRNKNLDPKNHFDTPQWEELEVYDGNS